MIQKLTYFPGKWLILALSMAAAGFMPGFSAEPVSTPEAGGPRDLVSAADPQYADESRAASWNASVGGQSRSDDDPWSISSMNFRIYGGYGFSGPRFGGWRPTYALDVKARFEECLEGYAEISALDIGGLLYERPDPCGHENWQEPGIDRPGNAKSNWDDPAANVEPNAGKRAIDEKFITCDPVTWNCRSGGN